MRVTADGALARPPADPWRAFAAVFAAVATALAALCLAFIVAMDPYGIRVGPDRPPTPIMGSNQRYMYPQLVRSGRFDSAVFGASTVRLLDPEHLNRLFGGRFANLGINRSTPWEQMQLAELFLRRVAHPKVIILGLDQPWCAFDADQPNRRTFLSFPPWLYEDPPKLLSSYANLFNLFSIEVAVRVALNRLGLRPERVRGDGFEVFVPPDGTYDLIRARQHIWSGAPHPVEPVSPPVVLSEAERAGLKLPAVQWLDSLLERAPPTTQVILVFPPIHVAAQAQPGSLAAASDAECKRRFADVARRHNALLVDFRRPSSVTTEDSNYWDALHIRIGVAARVAQALHDACADGSNDRDGFYEVLTAPRISARGNASAICASGKT